MVIFTCHMGDAASVSFRLDPEKFDPNLEAVLKAMNFQKTNDEPSHKCTVIEIHPATPRVQKQIGQYNEADQFGPESMTPRAGFSIYRFRGMAMMLYSPQAQKWELGVSKTFGGKEAQADTKVIFSRIISLAVAKQGVIGFWGVPVSEGMVLMTSKESRGEAVFFDLKGHHVFSFDGQKSYTYEFKFLRLDKTLKGRQVVMSREEILGLLSNRCTFFSYYGLPNNLKMILRSLTDTANAFNYPFENFEPRPSLDP